MPSSQRSPQKSSPSKAVRLRYEELPCEEPVAVGALSPPLVTCLWRESVTQSVLPQNPFGSAAEAVSEATTVQLSGRVMPMLDSGWERGQSPFGGGSAGGWE